MAERIVLEEPLTKRPLADKDLLGIFVFAIETEKGSCPADIIMLQKGLRVASEKLPLLNIFLGPGGEMLLSKELKSGFDSKSFEGRQDEQWGKIHLAESAKREVAIKIEEIVTSKGQDRLREAAEAAKKVWEERAI